MHNETTQILYTILSNVFLLLATYLYTSKKDIHWSKTPNSKTQTHLAFFVYTIDLALTCILNHLHKIHSNTFPYVYKGHSIVLFFLIILIVKRNGEKLSDIGFNFNHATLNFIFLLPIVALPMIPGGNEILKNGFKMFSAMIGGIILEEFLFRSYLQSRFESHFGSTRGLFLSSFFFAASHLARLLGGDVVDANFIMRLSFNFFGGLFMGIIFIRTRSLLPSILAHTVGNMLLL